MLRRSLYLSLALACAACGPKEPAATNEMADLTQNEVPEANIGTPASTEPGEPGGLPDDRNLVEEGAIDPDSGQGAAQVLQSYAALLEQGRYDEARHLRSEGQAEAGFAAPGKYAEIHAEIGAPGRLEGAAGSIYVEIPIRFYGRRKDGVSSSSRGTATLRRVNDVPGSTAEQRRWHIIRMDVQPPL